MRLLALGLALTMITACGAEPTQRVSELDSATVDATTTLPPSTTTSTVTSSTLPDAEPDENDGTESIGVTDEVTITVTDPP